MAEETNPTSSGEKGKAPQQKLRLKVRPIEENQPRVRKKVVTAVPAPKPGVGAAAAVEERRVGAGRIVRDVGSSLLQSMRNWDRKVWLAIGIVVAGLGIGCHSVGPGCCLGSGAIKRACSEHCYIVLAAATGMQ